MTEIKLTPKVGSGIEYFCNACGQLRLSLLAHPTVDCGNCGSRDIITGKPDELDKDKLKVEYDSKYHP